MEEINNRFTLVQHCYPNETPTLKEIHDFEEKCMKKVKEVKNRYISEIHLVLTIRSKVRPDPLNENNPEDTNNNEEIFPHQLTWLCSCGSRNVYNEPNCIQCNRSKDISQFETSPPSETDLELVKSDHTCTICFENLPKLPFYPETNNFGLCYVKSLACPHYLHISCLRGHVESSYPNISCPQCKAKWNDIPDFLHSFQVRHILHLNKKGPNNGSDLDSIERCEAKYLSETRTAFSFGWNYFYCTDCNTYKKEWGVKCLVTPYQDVCIVCKCKKGSALRTTETTSTTTTTTRTTTTVPSLSSLPSLFSKTEQTQSSGPSSSSSSFSLRNRENSERFVLRTPCLGTDPIPIPTPESEVQRRFAERRRLQRQLYNYTIMNEDIPVSLPTLPTFPLPFSPSPVLPTENRENSRNQLNVGRFYLDSDDIPERNMRRQRVWGPRINQRTQRQHQANNNNPNPLPEEKCIHCNELLGVVYWVLSCNHKIHIHCIYKAVDKVPPNHESLTNDKFTCLALSNQRQRRRRSRRQSSNPYRSTDTCYGCVDHWRIQYPSIYRVGCSADRLDRAFQAIDESSI